MTEDYGYLERAATPLRMGASAIAATGSEIATAAALQAVIEPRLAEAGSDPQARAQELAELLFEQFA